MKRVMKNILLVMIILVANLLKGDFDQSEAYRILGAENLYDVLNIAEGATRKDILKTYQVLARKFHPDKLVNEMPEDKDLGKVVFEKTLKAYQTLNKEESKIEYDKLQEATNKFNNEFKALLALYAKKDVSFEDQAIIFLRSVIDAAQENITHKAWLLLSYMFELNDLYQKVGFPFLAPDEYEIKQVEAEKNAIKETKKVDIEKANDNSNSIFKRNYYYKKGLDQLFTLAVLDENLRVEYFNQWLNWLEMLRADNLESAKEKYTEMRDLIDIYFIGRSAVSQETKNALDEFSKKIEQPAEEPPAEEPPAEEPPAEEPPAEEPPAEEPPAEEPPAEEPPAEEPPAPVDVAQLQKNLVNLEVELMALNQIAT